MMNRWLLVFTVVGCAVDASQAFAQPTHDDVVYATLGTGELHMDVYRPMNQQAPSPCVVFIHGGGWASGSYNQSSGGAAQLNQRGIVVASIQYRLTTQEGEFGPGVPVTFPAQIHDVKGAVRFLRAHAHEYGIDAARIGVWGTSAGGHLTALLATSGGVAEAEGTTGGNLAYSSRVQAAADLFGPTDLLMMNLDVTTPPGSTIDHDAPTSPESRLLGWDEPGQGVGDIRANMNNPAAPYPALVALAELCSPITHVDANDPPMFIGHGLDDTSVPSGQSVRLANALAAVGAPHSLTLVEGAGHGWLGAQTNAAMMDFLENALSPCPGDITGDRRVSFGDLNVVLAQFGQVSLPGAPRPADTTGDGVVNFEDLNAVLSGFGADCR